MRDAATDLIASLEVVGTALRNLRRRKRHRSQRRVARAAAMEASQISRYETGNQDPSISVVLRLLAVYGMDLVDLGEEVRRVAQRSQK